MRTNVQRSLAMELSTLSMEFRKQQKAYLAKVKQTKEGGAMAADPLDQQGMHTLPPLALTPGAGPLHSLGPHNGEGGGMAADGETCSLLMAASKWQWSDEEEDPGMSTGQVSACA